MRKSCTNFLILVFFQFPLLSPGTTLKKFITCEECPDAGRQDSSGFIWHGWARGPTVFMISAFFSPYITKLARFAAAKNAPYDTGKQSSDKLFPDLM
jgi:hypothetical protein